MKALKVVVTTILTVALLGSAVAAAGSDSPTKKNDIPVVKVTDASGNDITDEMMITMLGTTSSYDKVNANLKSASTDVDAASNKPANLKGTDGSTLESKLQEVVGSDYKAADLKFDKIFDASIVRGGEVVKVDGPITIELQYSGSALAVVHQVEDGKWEVIKCSGSVKFTSPSGCSPFGIVVGTKVADDSKKSSDDGKKSAQTGEYVTKAVLGAAIVLAAAGVVCATRAKKSSAN